MVRTLSPGAIHVHPSSLDEALALARDFGFDGLEFDVRAVADMGAEAARAKFDAAGVAPAVFGLPVEWRHDEATWRNGLDELPRWAKAAADVGCRRTATWVLSASNDRAMEENLAFHEARFRPIAETLGEHGISLGLEFIGPKTIRDKFTHPFIYTQDGMLDLASRIGPNVGLLLDCWHWYTSGGTVEDLRRLRPEQIVYVHVNDAPAGIPVDEQIDNNRRLPGATGVIDMAGFVGALKAIGYDGPVATEPFDESLKSFPDDAARLTAVRDAMIKVGL